MGKKPELRINIYVEEDGGYSAIVPTHPGCGTQGETLKECLAMVEDALAGWCDAMVSDEEPFEGWLYNSHIE